MMLIKQINFFNGFLILIWATFFQLSAVDESATLPDPTALNATSLSFFEAPLKELQDRTNRFADYLSQLELTEDTQKDEEVGALVSKIDLSMRALINTKSKTAIVSPPRINFANSYSINSLIELHHQIRKKTIELKSNQDERQEMKRSFDAAQSSFDRQIELYRSLTATSEDKLEKGLRTIYYFLLLKISAEEQSRNDREIAVNEEELKRFKEELEFAQDHLQVSEVELLDLKAESDLLEKRWRQIQSNHRAKEAEQIIESYSPQSDGLVARQETMRDSLEEMVAKQNYLFSEIKLTLALLIRQPNRIDLSKVRTTLSSWQQLLKNTEQLVNNWLTKSQRVIERAGQLISLEGTNEGKGFTESLKLAQSNLLILQGIHNEIDDSDFLIGVIKNKVASIQGYFLHWFASFFSWLGKGYDTLKGWFDTTLFHMGLTPVTLLGLLRFSLILLFTLFASRFLIRNLSNYILERKKMSRAIVYRLSRLLHYLILTLGILLALSSIGFDFSSLLLVAGALGVGLGFGLQSIFNNFISGIIMLFESQLKIGDFIELSPNLKGEIREINVRSTIISTHDGVDVIVPNSEIISNKILNWTLKHPYRRFHVPFSVSYGSDLEFVKKVVTEAAAKIPQTLIKPGFAEPLVIMTKFADSGIELELLVWVNEKFTKVVGAGFSDYLMAINDTLTEHQISQPFPHCESSVTSLLGAKSIAELKDLLK